MTEKIEYIELKEFIRKTLLEIEQGAEIDKRMFKDAIEFEISVSRTEKIDGELKIYVAKGDKQTAEEKVAKIKFQIYPEFPKNNLDNLPRQANSNY